MDQAINRFASTLSGAFKAFTLYRQDNKALDEVMDNIVARFKAATQDKDSIKLGITNQSLVYEGDAIGARELARHFALALRGLGFREIIFKSPIQSRNFFQFLNILSSKDSEEVKFEKLLPLVGEDEEKPITLISLTANSLLIRMSDELLEKHLSQIKGTGYLEALNQAPIESLSDFYTWVCVRAEMLNKTLKSLVRNLTDAAREGYFPWERYLKVFPVPLKLKETFFQQLTVTSAPRPRLPTQMNLKFVSGKKTAPTVRPEWRTFLVGFSKNEIKMRSELLTTGGFQSGIQELELAEGLLKEEGINFNFGLRILTRFLGQKNPVPSQEKALKLGIGLWLRLQQIQDDTNLLSLSSTLRQNLAATHNVTLTLFPLKNLTIEAEMFGRITAYLMSLGEVVLPTLIQILDAEADRGMRRKLCHIITTIARERGADFLIDSLNTPSPFLLRNLIMILGDLRSPKVVPTLEQLAKHQQKIIRVEVFRSLGKIGTPEAQKALKQAGMNTRDKEEQESINTILSRFQ